MAAKGRGPGIDADRLRELHAEGKTISEIATEMGSSYSGVAHALSRLGLSRKNLEHLALRQDIPLLPEHKRARPIQYMRELSQMAQGKMISAHRRVTAIRWATGMLEQGLDVAYDPEVPASEFCPQGGFYTVPLGAENGYRVDRLLAAAKAASENASVPSSH